MYFLRKLYLRLNMQDFASLYILGKHNNAKDAFNKGLF